MNVMTTASYQLERSATRKKKSGDLTGAVDDLLEVKRLAGAEYADTRLAKYLQAAGRFDEALEEIGALISDSQHYVKTIFSHQPVTVQQCQRAQWLMRIHKDAALICKREKRFDLAALHLLSADGYRPIVERLRPIAEKDSKDSMIARHAQIRLDLARHLSRRAG
ncbi:MAG: hypothetical protein K2X51_01675 [Burkholderiales bacterium]|nr:hypothetical protein [Burkholderiales bacterium]